MLISPLSVSDYLLAHGSLLVSNTDAHRRITYCNAALLEASGYTRGELLGRPLAILDHPEMPQEVRRDLWAALEAGDTWSAVVQHRSKDGRAYWVQTTAAALRDSQPDARYVIAYARPRHEDIRLPLAHRDDGRIQSKLDLRVVVPGFLCDGCFASWLSHRDV